MADSLKVLSYEGVLGIEKAENLSSIWKSLILEGYSLIINLSRVEAVDLSIIQLLISAKISAGHLGLSVQIANLISPAALTVFVLCGLVAPGDLNGRDLDNAIDAFISRNGESE